MSKTEMQTEHQFSKEDCVSLTKSQVWIMVLSMLAQISVVVLMIYIMH